jgi:hypothetical protein
MAVDNRRKSLQPVTAVRQLHAVVRDARERLTSPTIENLDYCRRRMDEAAGAFRQLQAAIPAAGCKPDDDLSTSLAELRVEIARVGILLDSAAAFHSGWIQRAGGMVSGYTDKGTPAAPEATSRVILEI